MGFCRDSLDIPWNSLKFFKILQVRADLVKEACTWRRVLASSLVSGAPVGREIRSRGEVPVSPTREFFTTSDL